MKAFAEMYGPGKATKMGWWESCQQKAARVCLVLDAAGVL